MTSASTPNPSSETVPKDFSSVDNPHRFNKGAVYVSGFRWLLLLLFALLLEKAADGIIQRTVYSPQFLKPEVLAPFVNIEQPPFSSILTPHWTYISGLLQFAVTLLFAIRYFLCLIDPLERKAGLNIEGLADHDSKIIWNALREVGGLEIAIVSVTSLLEFVLLYHAVMSFGSFQQWATFLLLLVIVDSLIFFCVVRNLAGVAKRQVKVIEDKIKKANAWRINKLKAISGNHLEQTLSQDVDALQVVEALSTNSTIKTQVQQIELHFRAELAKQTERQEYWKLVQQRFQRVTGDYGPWNLLDGLTIALTLLAFHYRTTPSWPQQITNGELGGLGLSIVVGLTAIILLLKSVSKIPSLKRPILIGFATFVGLLTMCLVSDVRFSWCGKIFSSQGMEFVLLSLLTIATSFFCYRNYHCQPQLWHAHVKVLKAATG
jgi:hypothetical protein